MSAYTELAEAGTNYPPTPWDIAKTMFYWDDLASTPDVPLPKGWRLKRKNLEGIIFSPELLCSSMTESIIREQLS